MFIWNVVDYDAAGLYKYCQTYRNSSCLYDLMTMFYLKQMQLGTAKIGICRLTPWRSTLMMVKMRLKQNDTTCIAPFYCVVKYNSFISSFNHCCICWTLFFFFWSVICWTLLLCHTNQHIYYNERGLVLKILHLRKTCQLSQQVFYCYIY